MFTILFLHGARKKVRFSLHKRDDMIRISDAYDLERIVETRYISNITPILSAVVERIWDQSGQNLVTDISQPEFPQLFSSGK